MRRRVDIDRIILELAAPTLSVVHARDLRAADVSDGAVARRVRDGWMAPIVGRSFGVGPLGASPTFEMSCMAAALAAGPHARVDGVTAATLLELWNRSCDVVHVSAPDNTMSNVPAGFRFTRLRGVWLPDDGQHVGPVPVAGIRDMASTFARDHSAWQLAFVIGRAIFRGRVTLEELDEHAAARTRAPGNATLRAAIQLVRDRSAGTRSMTEDGALGDLILGGAPVPIVNTRGALGMSRDEPDFVWLGPLRNIEMDGRQHDEPAQAEDDARRDQEAIDRGCAVLRVRARDYWRHRSRVVGAMLRFVGGRAVPTVPNSRILDVRRL